MTDFPLFQTNDQNCGTKSLPILEEEEKVKNKLQHISTIDCEGGEGGGGWESDSEQAAQVSQV